MNCTEVSKHFADYLAGDLDESLQSRFEKHLSECESCHAETESLKSIWMKLEQLPGEEPAPALSARFYAMLEAYREGQKQVQPRWSLQQAANAWLSRWWPRQPVLQFGLALALLLVGMFLGYRMTPARQSNQELALLRSELFNLRQMVTTSLLQNRSPSERLKGVSYSYSVVQPDRETLSALLNTLNYDSNLNVRLAAVDALTNFYEQKLVRQGLIQSLSRQTFPLIQIALIDLFVEKGEKQAVPAMRELKENPELNPTVHKRVEKAIAELEEGLQ